MRSPSPYPPRNVPFSGDVMVRRHRRPPLPVSVTPNTAERPATAAGDGSPRLAASARLPTTDSGAAASGNPPPPAHRRRAAPTPPGGGAQPARVAPARSRPRFGRPRRPCPRRPRARTVPPEKRIPESPKPLPAYTLLPARSHVDGLRKIAKPPSTRLDAALEHEVAPYSERAGRRTISARRAPRRRLPPHPPGRHPRCCPGGQYGG